MELINFDRAVLFAYECLMVSAIRRFWSGGWLSTPADQYTEARRKA
jgi:hypothetical protein